MFDAGDRRSCGLPIRWTPSVHGLDFNRKPKLIESSDKCWEIHRSVSTVAKCCKLRDPQSSPKRLRCRKMSIFTKNIPEKRWCFINHITRSALADHMAAASLIWSGYSCLWHKRKDQGGQSFPGEPLIRCPRTSKDTIKIFGRLEEQGVRVAAATRLRCYRCCYMSYRTKSRSPRSWAERRLWCRWLSFCTAGTDSHVVKISWRNFKVLGERERLVGYQQSPGWHMHLSPQHSMLNLGRTACGSSPPSAP